MSKRNPDGARVTEVRDRGQAMTEDRWIVEVSHRPEHYHTETPVFDRTYAGPVEKYARDEFARRCNSLNNPWVSSVELFHNGASVASWNESTNLSERQRRIRDHYLAETRRYEQAEAYAQEHNTVEARREARGAEEKQQVAYREFCQVMLMSEVEYERELEIRSRYALKDPPDAWPYGQPELSTAKGGVVYWRGEKIDEWWGTPVQPGEYVQEMAAHCRHLEALRVPVNMTTFVFYFGWFRMMEPGHSYKDILAHLVCGYWEKPTTGELMLVDVENEPSARALYYDGAVWHRIWYEEGSRNFNGPWEYHGLWRRGWRPVQLDQGEQAFVCDASLSAVVTWLADHAITPDFFDQKCGGPWCQRGLSCHYCNPTSSALP